MAETNIRRSEAMKTNPSAPFFTIKRGTVPPKANATKYPIRDMKVGDWFDAPREAEHSVRVRASQQGKKYGRIYSVRRINDQRVRVHRIA